MPKHRFVIMAFTAALAYIVVLGSLIYTGKLSETWGVAALVPLFFFFHFLNGKWRG
jgi:hypothetical protein